MKKFLSLLTAFIMLMTVIGTVPAFAVEDTVPPQIDFDSLKLEIIAQDGKNTVTAGDKVVFSVNLSDEAGISTVPFVLYSPDNDTNAGNAVYNSSTQEAVFTFDITDSTAAGEWKLFGFGAEDVNQNRSVFFNSELVTEASEGLKPTDSVAFKNLSAFSFTVEQEEQPEDNDAPVIDAASLKLTFPGGKARVASGDKVKLSLSVTDKTDVSEVNVYFYLKNNNSTVPCSLVYNTASNVFEGEFSITQSAPAGEVAVSYIYAADSLNNFIELYNSALYDAENKADLSAGNFRILRSLLSTTISDMPNQKYTGREVKPEPFIKDNSYVLLKDKDYTLTYQNNIKGGKASITITGIGDYSGSITKFFMITGEPAPAPAPKVITPKGTKITKLIKGKKSFTAKWKKVKGINGYEIRYSTSKKFKKAKTKRIKKAKTVKLRIRKLKAKKYYYVKLRTYKTVKGKKYYSKWSKVKRVKTL